MSNDLNNINKDSDLWRQIRFSLSKSKAAPEYCGHEDDEELLENKLWQYADGAMDEAEENNLWEQIKECNYCLLKLHKLQKALNATGQEEGYSLAKIKKLIHRKTKSNVLEIALKFVADSLELISSSGLLLTPQPVPVLRTGEKEPPATTCRNLIITEEFDQYKVAVEIQKINIDTCNLVIKIDPAESGVSMTGLRVNLLAGKKLLASYTAHEGRAVFSDINPGSYRVILTGGKGVIGEVVLNIG